MTVLSAMPCWFYDKKDLRKTPSIIEGLSLEQESRYRREGARFIINVGTKMGLRYDTMATGVVYFHRFYMFHSFKTFPRFITACCCLFLAGKVEETPKKCKDIIKVTKSFLNEKQFLQFGDDPKEEVMTLERILLQTIKFDLQVDHPYGYLLKYAKCLKGDKGKLEKMVQMAWTFINDSLCTTLSLQWEPEVIAIALMHLAGKLSKFEVTDWTGRTPKHSKWWDMYVQGMTIDLLEDICHQVLDLYSTPVPEKSPDSPPATPPSKSTIVKVKPASPVLSASSPVTSKSKEVTVGQPIPRLEPGELKRKVAKSMQKTEGTNAKIPRLSNSTSATQSSSIATAVNSSPKKPIEDLETKQCTPESSETKNPNVGHFIPTIETAYHTGLTSSSQSISTIPVMAEPIRTIITKSAVEPIHVQPDKTCSNPCQPPPPPFTVPEGIDTFYADTHQASVPRSTYPQNSQFLNPPIPLSHDPSLIQPPPPRPPPNQYEDIYRPPAPPVQPPPLPPPQTHFPPPPMSTNIRPMGQYPPPPASHPQPSVMPNVSLPPPNMPQMPPIPSNARNEHMHGSVSNMTAPPPPLSHGIGPPQNASPHLSMSRPPLRNFRPRPELDSYGHDHRNEPEHLPSPRMPMPIRGPPPPRFMRDGLPPPHREILPPPHHEYSHFDRERPVSQYRQQPEPKYERDRPRDPYMEYEDYGTSRGPPQNQYEYDNLMRRRYPTPQRNHERAPPPPMMINNRPRMESPTGIPPVRITGRKVITADVFESSQSP